MSDNQYLDAASDEIVAAALSRIREHHWVRVFDSSRSTVGFISKSGLEHRPPVEHLLLSLQRVDMVVGVDIHAMSHDELFTRILAPVDVERVAMNSLSVVDLGSRPAGGWPTKVCPRCALRHRPAAPCPFQ